MKMAADIRSLCRAYTPETVRIVAGIVRAKETRDSDRLTGIAMLWDRGWGKAPQAHTGENGEGDIRVIVRHILDTRDKPVAQAHLAPDNSVVHLTIDHDGDRDG